MCTFCLSKMCKEFGSLDCTLIGYYQFKFLGLHLGQETLQKPFYTWVTFFKVSQISPGDPISTELCLQLHFRRLYLCILFALKYASYLEFQL